MDAASAPADILIAATHLDERLSGCLADYRAKLVRTFDDAKRALREQIYRLIVIDLDFDGVRTFDLLQYVRSLADFKGVPVVCVQASDPGAGFSAALDRMVRSLGGRAFVDLRGDGEKSCQASDHLCQIVASELGIGANGSRCVLVIDSDVDAAHRLGGLVETMGHDVDYAYDGVAGLDAARRLRPDVVFLTLALRGIDGVQLARELRQHADSRNAYIVGIAEPGNESACTAALDEHIVKPVSALRVQGVLRQRR